MSLYYTAFNQIVLAPQHLPGKENRAADHLSRDALSSFLQLVPSAQHHPTPLPVELILALVTQRPDWTSASWRAVLRTGEPYCVFTTDIHVQVGAE